MAISNLQSPISSEEQMKPTTSNEIRQAFLEFFNELNHEIVPSAPLPQHDNPTLLFTNAG
ncbi:MAG: hypothetical protein KC441_11880, partial [Anaerolineales bacterium]|nr:hypothetical protein [Anaerolineales bacterium]